MDGELFLRPYQQHGLNEVRDLLRSGMRRVILYGPTGSGKTEAGVEILRAAKAKGKRALFCANRIQLVGQSSRRLSASGLQHGIMQGSNTADTENRVLVCSIHTLAKRGFPKEIDMLLIDEAHGVAGSAAYKRLMFESPVPVVGLTATPWSRGLGRDYPELGGPLFEGIAKSATIDELIKLGYLVDCDIYAPEEPDLSGVPLVRGADGTMDYDEKALAKAVDRNELVGGIVDHWRRLAGDRRTVVFATDIAHSKHIVNEFNKAGHRAEHIDCYTDDAERHSILKRLEDGDTRIVSNVSVLAEGWDCPCVEVMVLARPTRSLVRYIQMVGRALRPHAGKDKALVLDHSGSCKRFPYPTADLPLELDDGKRPAPTAAEEKAKQEKLPKECPGCHYMKPAGVWKCPQCGFEPVRQTDVHGVHGELVKFEKRTKPKQETWSELLSLGAKRKWSRGRVSHTFKDYYGVWPRGLIDVGREPSNEIIRFVQHRNIAFARSPNKPKPSPDAGWQKDALAA